MLLILLALIELLVPRLLLVSVVLISDTINHRSTNSTSTTRHTSSTTSTTRTTRTTSTMVVASTISTMIVVATIAYTLRQCYIYYTHYLLLTSIALYCTLSPLLLSAIVYRACYMYFHVSLHMH
jgi:cellobiose-specific phosphotransferase system component IIC